MNEDRRLGDELRRLGDREWQPPAGGAASAVRTARRRTGAGVAGLTAAVAAVALAVPLALDGQTVAAPLPPASPEVTASTAPAPAPSLPVTPTTRPSPSAPAPPVTPPGEQAAPSTSAALPPPAPPGPLILVEGEGGPTRAGTLADLRLTGFQLEDLDPEAASSGIASLGTSWFVDPCGDGTAEGDADRTGYFSVVAPGDFANGVQVATYVDAEAAADAVAALEAEVARCPGTGTVWRVWDGAGTDVLRLVSYDVDPTATAETPAAPQYGTQVLVEVDASSVVAVVAASLYIGTEIAYAVGDTRPVVGPADHAGGDARVAVDGRWAEIERTRSGVRAEVDAHLAGQATT